jgi:hypothetical protein
MRFLCGGGEPHWKFLKERWTDAFPYFRRVSLVMFLLKVLFEGSRFLIGEDLNSECGV